MGRTSTEDRLGRALVEVTAPTSLARSGEGLEVYVSSGEIGLRAGAIATPSRLHVNPIPNAAAVWDRCHGYYTGKRS
jgi:hypothetical protein